jgi:hypothetical protein
MPTRLPSATVFFSYGDAMLLERTWVRPLVLTCDNYWLEFEVLSATTWPELCGELDPRPPRSQLTLNHGSYKPHLRAGRHLAPSGRHAAVLTDMGNLSSWAAPFIMVTAGSGCDGAIWRSTSLKTGKAIDSGGFQVWSLGEMRKFLKEREVCVARQRRLFLTPKSR